MEARGRVLALDYGTRRVGWAVSDRTRLIVESVAAIEYDRPEKLWQGLERIVKESEIAAVVVGYPWNLDGTSGASAQAVEAFCLQLAARFKLPVTRWDERLTSVMAQKRSLDHKKKVRRRKSTIDALAAGIILDEYLQSTLDSGPQAAPACQ
jgi:putative Holliday junction resolvase